MMSRQCQSLPHRGLQCMENKAVISTRGCSITFLELCQNRRDDQSSDRHFQSCPVSIFVCQEATENLTNAKSSQVNDLPSGPCRVLR